MSDDTCPATNNRGEPCGHDAGWGTDNDSGPCKFHGGAAENQGAPEGNGNAIDHGARADPINLYQNLDDEATAWVDAKVDTYCEQEGIEPGTPTADLVHVGVMHLYQAYAAHGRLAEEGLSRTSVVGTTEAGAVTDEEAHYLNQVASQHTRDFRMAIKDAGGLDDPDSQQADAMTTIAEVLSE